VPFASLVLSLVITILFGIPAVAQDATPGATPVVAPAATPAVAAGATPTAGAAEILFVQSFTTGRLEPGAEAGAAILTLQGPVGETVYFSDRPERTAGTIALTQFLEILAQETAEPLNAALVIDRPEGDAVVVVELLDGTVDPAGTVIYDVLVLSESGAFGTDMTGTAELLTEVTGAMDFGSNHLFVDGACSPLDPRCCAVTCI
jgi:hypothetical protein